jgi:probable F420-dependent oxidoreductase
MESHITVNVQAAPRDAAAWTALAQRCERAGAGSLLVADHPGSGPAPFVALAAAATATKDLHLGTYVVNAGAWEPLALASAVATLDVVSGGRAVLGVGAGHTPSEWTMRGLPYPSPTQRVGRMVELIEVSRRLLGGETVTFRGDHLRTEQAHLEEPRPVQDAIPLVVGGNGSRVLHYAAQHADVVALSGLGRTLPDGHRHEVNWATDQIDERVELVHTAAEAAGRTPQLEALVQRLEITDDAQAAAADLAEQLNGVTADDLLAAPYVLFGTVDELVAELRAHQRRWGISRFVVRAGVMDAAEQLLAGLRAAATS